MKSISSPSVPEVNFSKFKVKHLGYRAAVSVAYHILGMCSMVIAESKAPELQSREIRKAIPVAQPSQNRAAEASAAKTGRNSRPAVTTGDETTDRISPGGISRIQANNAEAREAKSSAAPNTMNALNDKRPIGIRDKLSLSIVEDEAAPRQILVTDSGEVDFPYIGRIAVENRTCKQLALHLKNLLEKEYYYQATVLIGLDSAGGQTMSKGKYYLDGQVNRTGQYEIPVDEVLTVSKAIIRAGGFTQYANRKKVRVMRKATVKQQAGIFFADMVEVMEKGQARSDIEILPDDQIFVDEKFFNF